MRGHCARCDRDVEAAYERPRLRRWAKVYFLLPVPFVPVFPIIASDFSVMLPLLMVYLLGIGPVLGVLRDPASCTTCGAMVPSPTR